MANIRKRRKKNPLIPLCTLSVYIALAGCGSDDDDDGIIRNINNNQAPIVSISGNTLTEDSVSNSTVAATFEASDPDGDELTLSLKDNDKGYFKITDSNITLTSAGVTAVNDDVTGLTQLTVTLSANDSQSISEATTNITVNRINDSTITNNAPSLTVVTNQLTEDQVTTETVVATATATDADGDALVFTINDNDQGYFKLANEDIVLTNAGVEAINDDAMALISLPLSISVTDSIETNTKNSVIAISRVNDAPVISDVTVNTLIEDDISTDTVVVEFAANDSDNSQLTYTLSGDNSSYFILSGNQILLTTTGVEAVNDDSLNLESIPLTLEVSDGTETATHNLSITITRVDDTPSEEPRYIKLFEDNFESGTTAKWTVENFGGNRDWSVESFAGNKFAVGNCYGSDAACDDWLISPELDLSQFTEAAVSFTNAWKYGVNPLNQIKLKISTNYIDDATTAAWSDLSDQATWSPGDFEFVNSGFVSLDSFVGQSIRIAFHYAHPVADSTKWEVDDIIIDGKAIGEFPLDAEIVVANETFYTGRHIQLGVNPMNGAGEPFTYAWDFGDSNTSTEKEPLHSYENAGNYEVQVTVTDKDNNTVVKSVYLSVEAETVYSVPAKSGDFRIATFNIGLPDSQTEAGVQDAALSGGEDAQGKKIAEIIQRTNPDILLINEIDGNDSSATVATFMNDYLEVSQNGVATVQYDYVYASDCNTGVDSGLDFNNNGTTGEPDDAYGFGRYPGQYCMVILSKYEIDTASARTFQNFLWKDMPDANEPFNTDATPYYSTEAWDAFRLSSKTHIDLPIVINGETVHVLASHPTPPVFDGDEDRNGKRNFDEIRMWADYIDPNAGAYLYDDNNVTGVSLAAETRFVILGDENASSVEGDAFTNDDNVTAIDQLLDSTFVNPFMGEDSSNSQIPVSAGGTANDPDNAFSSTHTAGWRMRADYVLPSAYGLEVAQSGVFWPMASDDLSYLTNDQGGANSSDHRLVWMDLNITFTTVFDGATATTIISEDNFEDLNGFTVISTGDDSKDWYASSFGGNNFAKISCFEGTEQCVDWLIKEVDLTTAQAPVLTFDSIRNQYGPADASDISLMVSTDFDGTNTDTATWIDLSAQAQWAENNGSWSDTTVSGDIDLSAYKGGVLYIAFVYDSDPSNSTTWEILNFLVSSTEPLDPVISEDNFEDLNGFTVISTGDDSKDWYASSFGGNNFAKISCFEGTEQCVDWLIKEVDLTTAQAPVLTFDSIRNQYGPADASDISLMVSTDFDGTNTDTATWIDLSAQAQWAENNGSWSDTTVSGDIDLSAYKGGVLYIAFVYDSDPSNSTTWEILNFLVNDNAIAADSGTSSDVVVTGDIPAANASLNAINKRASGTLEFTAVAAPTTLEEKEGRIGSTGLSVDSEAVPNSGYKTLLTSGQQIDGNVYAQVIDNQGSDLFVSNYNEFTSILPVEDRIFAVSQFENIPGGMHVVELNQDSTTGELTPISTSAIDFSALNGGYNHCAAMVTPWNTHLASEEYEPDYGARDNATGEIDSYYDQIGMYHADKSLIDVNPYWYGYSVEVALNLNAGELETSIQKHYAMGRMSQEIAYVMPDQKTVYITDDGTNGGLYLFIADTEADLSAGTLYAMKWNQTDSGSAENAGMGAADLEWISLGHATSAEIDEMVNGETPLSFNDIFDRVEPTSDNVCPLGYTSINFKGSGNQECLRVKSGMERAASRLEVRRYAALMGATVEMRKEEGFTYNPHNHKAYMAIAELEKGMLSQADDFNDNVGGPDHIQISEDNDCGGIYELTMGSSESIGSDYVAASLKGIVSGTEEDGACAVDGLADPDNVAYVGYDTLVITEDSGDHENNFVWSYNLNTEALTRIFSAPSGAENTGPYMFNNINGFSYITNVVQHPAGESTDPSAGNEAELGYFGPIPVAESSSSAMSVTEALSVTVDQQVVEVVGVITSTVVNQDFALEMADVNDSSQVIVVKLNGDDRNTWGPQSNPGVAGTTITVVGERDLNGYSGRQSIEGDTEITAN